jgi:hypothetical protein
MIAAAVLDLPILGDFIPSVALQIIAIFILLLIFILICINLSMIYTAYMKICMPDELTEKEDKKSRLGFVNKFKEYIYDQQKIAASPGF